MSLAETVLVSGLEVLLGGAIRENWGFGADFIGGRFAGRHRLVLRTDAATGIASSLGRIEEFAVVQAARAAGVTVPEPLWACADPAVIGKPFFIMRRVEGTAQGRRITADRELEQALPRIAARLAEELVRLQTVRPPCPALGFLPAIGAAEHIAGFRAYLDGHAQPRPVLEWAVRWLETHTPEPLPMVLCHRDFRTGNYLLNGPELTGILDWEFAGWGDPDEDIGWLCCKGWRFARLDRGAGGIVERPVFYRAYEEASGRRLDPERVRFWEVLANIRWAVIALQQSDRHLIGGARDLSTAIIGRRASECELELLMLLDVKGPPASCRQAGGTPVISGAASASGRMGPGCWRLVASCCSTNCCPCCRLSGLVMRGSSLPRWRSLSAKPPPAMRRHARSRRGSPSFTKHRRRVDYRAGRMPALPKTSVLYARFARDLRIGAFEACEARARDARAILWQLTMLKLREGNPRFLVRNGFGE